MIWRGRGGFLGASKARNPLCSLDLFQFLFGRPPALKHCYECCCRRIGASPAEGEDARRKNNSAGFVAELRPLLRLRWLQLLTLAGLLVTVGVIAFNLKFSVLDLDIWWHLKVGDWIVQHHGTFPTPAFSRGQQPTAPGSLTVGDTKF